MKRYLTILLILTVTAAFLTACAATPEQKPAEEVTTEKGEDDTPEEEPAKSDVAEDAIQAYAAFLASAPDMIGENILTAEKEIRYALIHLDGDEVPELALALGNAHASKVAFFSFAEGEVKEVFSTGSFGNAAYEKGTGIIIGQYSGMGMWHTDIGVFSEGVLSEEIRVSLTDIEAAREAMVWDAEGTGYYFEERDGDFWGTPKVREITEKEYDTLLEPYLPKNRDYRKLNYDTFPVLLAEDDIVEALRTSLEEEDSLPKTQETWFSDPRNITGFDTAMVIEMLQGEWTSVGQSGSVKWVIENENVKILNAIWAEDYSGPTGEYELDEEVKISSIEMDVGQWDGTFLIRLEKHDGYYVYTESNGQVVLENHWDPDGYSASSSMEKASGSDTAD